MNSWFRLMTRLFSSVRRRRKKRLAPTQQPSVATQLRRISDAVASALERSEIIARLVRGVSDLTHADYVAVISRGVDSVMCHAGEQPRARYSGESWESGLLDLLAKLLQDSSPTWQAPAVLPTDSGSFERKTAVTSFRLISGRIHFLPVTGSSDSDLYLVLVGDLDHQMLEYLRVILVSASVALSKSGQFQELVYEVENRKLISEHLGKALDFRDQFVANVTHEVRTPICSTIGFVELLLKDAYGPLSAEQREVLCRVLENSNNLLQLVNNILDHSKVEAGKVQVNERAGDIREFVEELVETCMPLIKDRAVTLELMGQVPHLLVKTDWTLLRQIGINLISNAIKFTSRGKVTVEAHCDTVAGEVRFVVSDTGIGIAEDRLAEIFEPFKQLDNAYTKKFAGTGLGLSLTKKYVEMLKGSIYVESVVGRGSIFSVTFPVEFLRAKKNNVENRIS